MKIRNLFVRSYVFTGFSAWSLWSSCSKSCDYGVRERSRLCTGPECQANTQRGIEYCFNQPCGTVRKGDWILFSFLLFWVKNKVCRSFWLCKSVNWHCVSSMVTFEPCFFHQKNMCLTNFHDSSILLQNHHGILASWHPPRFHWSDCYGYNFQQGNPLRLCLQHKEDK